LQRNNLFCKKLFLQRNNYFCNVINLLQILCFGRGSVFYSTTRSRENQSAFARRSPLVNYCVLNMSLTKIIMSLAPNESNWPVHSNLLRHR